MGQLLPMLIVHVSDKLLGINVRIIFLDIHDLTKISTAVCTTSRYTFLSGNYAHRSPRMKAVSTLNYAKGSFRREHKTIAQVLKNAGYTTAMTGKWHLGGMFLLLACNFSQINS